MRAVRHGQIRPLGDLAQEFQQLRDRLAALSVGDMSAETQALGRELAWIQVDLQRLRQRQGAKLVNRRVSV